jgi:hypothetical protein
MVISPRAGVVLTVVVLAAATVRPADILLHSSTSWYNKSYPDERFKDKSRVSFAVPLSTIGFEAGFELPAGARYGLGAASSAIGSGRTYNLNRWEEQPRTRITVPYMFGGYSGEWAALELGVGAYLHWELGEAVSYLTPEGSERQLEAESFFLDRRRSHACMNAMLRVFPENGFHVKVRFGREDFIPVDSLLNICFSLPYRTASKIELILASALPGKALFDDEYAMASNQRAALRCQRRLGPLDIGASASVLFGNQHGGGGSIPFLNRLGAGLDIRFAGPRHTRPRG